METHQEQPKELCEAISAQLTHTTLGAVAKYTATTETTIGTEGQTNNQEPPQSNQSESDETFTSLMPQENAAPAFPKAKADQHLDEVSSGLGEGSRKTDEENKQGCRMTDHKQETSTSGVNVKKLFFCH
jgi:hypothetical protein